MNQFLASAVVAAVVLAIVYMYIRLMSVEKELKAMRNRAPPVDLAQAVWNMASEQAPLEAYAQPKRVPTMRFEDMGHAPDVMEMEMEEEEEEEEEEAEVEHGGGMVEAVESIGVSQDVVVDQPKVETPSRFPAPPLVPPNVHTPHKLIVEDAAMDEIAALRPPPIRRQTGGPRRRKSPSDQ